MAKLKDIPTELVLLVASHLPNCQDLASFAATSRRNYDIVNPELYHRDLHPQQLVGRLQPRALMWAAEYGNARTARMAFAAGSDIDGAFRSCVPYSEWRGSKDDLKAIDEVIALLRGGKEVDDSIKRRLKAIKERDARRSRSFPFGSRYEDESGSEFSDDDAELEEYQDADDDATDDVEEEEDDEGDHEGDHEGNREGDYERQDQQLSAHEIAEIVASARGWRKMNWDDMWGSDVLVMENLAKQRKRLLDVTTTICLLNQVRYDRLPYWWTPLHLAIYHGHVDLVDLLHDAQASFTVTSRGLCDCRLVHIDDIRDSDHDGGFKSHRRQWHPLHTAICRGHDGIVEKVLAEAAGGIRLNFLGASPVTRISEHPSNPDGCYLSALHTAAYQGNIPMMKAIFDSGHLPPENPRTGDTWGVDILDEFGYTPLFHAWAARQWRALEWLVKKGANIDVVVDDCTPMMLSIRRRFWDHALRLLQLGASPDPPIDLHTPLMLLTGRMTKPRPGEARHKKQRLLLLDQLLKMGAKVDRPDETRLSPLIRAIDTVDLDAMRAYIKAGADVEFKAFNHTPLYYACIDSGNGAPIPMLVDMLLDAGADMDHDRDYPVLFALCAGPRISSRPESVMAGVKHLLKRGANVNCQPRPGPSAVQISFYQGNLDATQVLIDHGATITKKTAEKFWDFAMERAWAAGIEFASKLGYRHLDIPSTTDGLAVLLEAMFVHLEHDVAANLKRLLELGIGPTTDTRGQTLLHIACSLPNHASYKADIVEMLIDRGFDVNARSSGGVTPLHVAISRADSNCVDILCHLGADPHACSPSFPRPVDLAMERALDFWPQTQALKESDEDIDLSAATQVTISVDDDEYDAILEPDPLDLLLSHSRPVDTQLDTTMYLASLFRFAVKPMSDLYRLKVLTQIMEKLYECVWSPRACPSPIDAGLALGSFLQSLKAPPLWLQSEDPQDAQENDLELLEGVHHVVHLLCMSSADIHVRNAAGMSAVEILDGILLQKDHFGWPGRLGSALSEVLSVEMQDGKQVIRFRARGLPRRRLLGLPIEGHAAQTYTNSELVAQSRRFESLASGGDRLLMD